MEFFRLSPENHPCIQGGSTFRVRSLGGGEPPGALLGVADFLISRSSCTVPNFGVEWTKRGMGGTPGIPDSSRPGIRAQMARTIFVGGSAGRSLRAGGTRDFRGKSPGCGSGLRCWSFGVCVSRRLEVCTRSARWSYVTSAPSALSSTDRTSSLCDRISHAQLRPPTERHRFAGVFRALRALSGPRFSPIGIDFSWACMIAHLVRLSVSSGENWRVGDPPALHENGCFFLARCASLHVF